MTTKIESKLSKAYAKVGKKIGQLYNVYSPTQYQSPAIDAGNWISIKKIAMTQSDFSNSDTKSDSDYECYGPFEDLKPGAIIVNNTDLRVFQIVNHEDSHGINGMLCNESITVSSINALYDGTASTEFTKYRSIPCNLTITNGDQSGALIGQATSGPKFTHSAKIKFQTTIPLSLLLADTIVDSLGFKYQISTIQFDNNGYELVCHGIRL